MTPLLAGLDWPSFELNGLTISSDGKVNVDGGWITLPELKTLDFHGFKIEISQLGFGAEEDNGADYNWVGFSGGVQIVSGLPLRGGVEGLKVMWSIAGNPPKLEIGGVSLGFEIEKYSTLMARPTSSTRKIPRIRITGYVDLKGQGTVGLIPLNGAGFDAQFIAGDNGQYKFFYLFIDVAIPVGIPVLPPALGLYGLAGLFAYNMTLDYPKLVKYENEASRPKMTDVENWINEEGSMAFGAGVTIGTLADNGFTVKAKVVFAIMIPGPVILIEGYAKLLSFEEAYLFRVLAVLDVPSGRFLDEYRSHIRFPEGLGRPARYSRDRPKPSSRPATSAGGISISVRTSRNRNAFRRMCSVSSPLRRTSWSIRMVWPWVCGSGIHSMRNTASCWVVLESWISSALAVSWMPLQALGTFTWVGRAELSVARIGPRHFR